MDSTADVKVKNKVIIFVEGRKLGKQQAEGREKQIPCLLHSLNPLRIHLTFLTKSAFY